MAKIIAAKAWCNNEVGYLAWNRRADHRPPRLHDHATPFRSPGNRGGPPHTSGVGSIPDAIEPRMEEQDISVWPVQKLSWRDLRCTGGATTWSRTSLVACTRLSVAVGHPSAMRWRIA